MLINDRHFQDVSYTNSSRIIENSVHFSFMAVGPFHVVGDSRFLRAL
jgi:hypothetical protein